MQWRDAQLRQMVVMINDEKSTYKKRFLRLSPDFAGGTSAVTKKADIIQGLAQYLRYEEGGRMSPRQTTGEILSYLEALRTELNGCRLQDMAESIDFYKSLVS